MLEPLKCPQCGSDRVHACGMRAIKFKLKAQRMPKIACDDCRMVYRADGKGDGTPYLDEFSKHLDFGTIEKH